MLNDGHGRFGVIVGAAHGGIGIDVVVVTHFLAVEKPCLGNTRHSPFADRTVNSSSLVSVFSVAKDVCQFTFESDFCWEARVFVLVFAGLTGLLLPLCGKLAGEPVGNCGIVTSGVGKGNRCQFAPLLQVGSTFVYCGDDLWVSSWFNHDGYVGIVFRRCSNHGWATDVDLFDNLLSLGTRGNGLHERVEIHHDQLERFNAKFN